MKRIFCVALVWIAFAGTAAVAGEGCQCCDHCGCSHDCCKVCRCVPDVKKVTKTEYSCECEDFCVPGKSDHCVVCDDCGKRQHIYTPTCATVRTRKKLVKHETTSEVMKYKWVVENLCPHCAAREEAQGNPSALAAAPAPIGAQGRQVTYQAVAPVQQPAANATAPSPPTASDGKSSLRRLFDPILGSGQSAR